MLFLRAYMLLWGGDSQHFKRVFMHILQHHIATLPPSVCEREEGSRLCCRGSCQNEGDSLVFSETVQWDTFFNVFPAQFFFRNTNIEDLQLHAALCGCGRLLVRGVCLDGSTVTLHEECFAQSTSQTVICHIPIAKDCVYYFMEIVPEQGAVTFYGATWETTSLPLQAPRIALVICTHQRKAQLVENLGQIALYTRCHPSVIDVLIVDNGGELTLPDLLLGEDAQSSDEFSLFTNPCNLGGAGGFARGIHEAVRREKYTHILLMDDDISLHPEMLGRLAQVLRHAVQPQTLAVSGVMLDRARPSIVVEWGASYPGHPKALAAGRDISQREQLMPPEECTEYSAWTFFCYPLTPDTAKELPLPLFIRGDDAEFGLRLSVRHGVQIATPASIVVWHHAFAENSYFVLYHTLRNELIINEMYKKIGIEILLRYIAIPLYHMLRKEYVKAEISIMAFHSFLSGSGELLSVEYENNYVPDVQGNIGAIQFKLHRFVQRYALCAISMSLYFFSGLKLYKKIVKCSRLVWVKYFISKQ